MTKRKDTEKLRLMDDAFFRMAAARKEVCQEILRTLLDEEKLIVVSVTVQEEMVSLFRKIRLDALCVLSDGRLCNIEVQKGNENDDIRRVRFHASSVTANKTSEGTIFADVPNVKVIYISEYDALNNGQMVTLIKRCQKLGDSYVPIDDGEEIIFANTKIKDESKKARLLAHFLDRDSFKDSEFPEISNVMHYLKETDEGKAEVKSVTEQWVEEGIEIGIKQGIEQGKAEGKAEGITEGKTQSFILLYKKGHISLDVATKELDVSKEEFLEMVSKDEQPVDPET